MLLRITYTPIQRPPIVLCKKWLGKIKKNPICLVLDVWILVLEKYSLKAYTKGQDQGCYLQLKVRCLSAQIHSPCVQKEDIVMPLQLLCVFLL